MPTFTPEETNLLCIYTTGSRAGLIEALTEMRGELSPEEAELRELTDSALSKLQAMSDVEFAELELYPVFLADDIFLRSRYYCGIIMPRKEMIQCHTLFRFGT